MRIAAIIQLVWAIGLFVLLAVPFFMAAKGSSMLWATGASVFLLTALGAFCDNWLAWIVALCCDMIVLVMVGAIVFWNILMFVMGHELYKDSPATIVVVFIGAVLFVAPPAAICLLVYTDRDKLRCRHVAK